MGSAKRGPLRGGIERGHRASWGKAWAALVTTLPPLVVCCMGAHRWLSTCWPASLACSVLATGFLVRTYIIQHDCGHGSFLPSSRANDALGCVLGVLTLLPYFRWRHDHARHHATSGDLTRRGTGDVWTLTLREYESAPLSVRLRYRLYRQPIVLFGLGPLVLFVVLQRLTYWTRTRRERLSVHTTSAAAACLVALGVHELGWRQVLGVEGAITWMGATVAVWLFYVQHQFEETFWDARPGWDRETGALQGASYYRLPPVLQFFTGSIGLHHVHHVAPGIPSYELQRCLDAHAELQDARVLTLWSSLRCASLRLWDEETRRLVSWDEALRTQARAPRESPRGLSRAA